MDNHFFVVRNEVFSQQQQDATNIQQNMSSTQEAQLKRYIEEEQIYSEPFVAKEEGYSKASILMDVIRQLSNGGDLYRISLPSALLSPVSLLEYVATYIQPHDMLLKYIYFLIYLKLIFFLQSEQASRSRTTLPLHSQMVA